MKRIKLKSISTIFLAGLVFVMTGCAAGEYAYDTWDADTNAYLDETEFDIPGHCKFKTVFVINFSNEIR